MCLVATAVFILFSCESLVLCIEDCQVTVFKTHEHYNYMFSIILCVFVSQI